MIQGQDCEYQQDFFFFLNSPFLGVLRPNGLPERNLKTRSRTASRTQKHVSIHPVDRHDIILLGSIMLLLFMCRVSALSKKLMVFVKAEQVNIIICDTFNEPKFWKNTYFHEIGLHIFPFFKFSYLARHKISFTTCFHMMNRF